MNERILLVGEDPLLLETRALILAEWQTIKSSSSEFQRHVDDSFALVILGHSVPLETTKTIIACIEEMDGPPAVLALRPPHESGNLNAEVHVMDLFENPVWLRDYVSKLLSSKTISAKALSPTQTSRIPTSEIDAGN